MTAFHGGCGMMSFPHVMVCLVLLASMYAPPAATLAPTSGAHPDQHALYAGSEFSCADGGAMITINRVNDDYCDCDDGSDEPGTSACAGMQALESPTFLCENAGLESVMIFASRVRDGVCDCCDGTNSQKYYI
jgi:protein kinase C substrate 80K-H